MNYSTLELPTCRDYSNYLWVWKPQETGDQGLFLVRVPLHLQQMSWRTYLHLMLLRIQWMIQTGLVQTGQPQIEVQRQLEQALAILNATQEPPSLYETSLSREPAPIPLWAKVWAEALIGLNETWKTKFQSENWQVKFPCPVIHPSDPRVQQQWREDHDEITLDNWLADLTYGMS